MSDRFVNKCKHHVNKYTLDIFHVWIRLYFLKNVRNVVQCLIIFWKTGNVLI